MATNKLSLTNKVDTSEEIYIENEYPKLEQLTIHVQEKVSKEFPPMQKVDIINDIFEDTMTSIDSKDKLTEDNVCFGTSKIDGQMSTNLSLQLEENTHAKEDDCSTHANEVFYHNLKDNPSNQKLYISKLPASVIEEDLVSIFSAYGKIKYTLIREHKMYNSGLKYAFLIFEDENSVTEILKKKHYNQDLELNCEEFVDKKPNHDKNQIDELNEKYNNKGFKLFIAASKKIFVKGFSQDVTIEDINDAFSFFGTVKYSYIIFNKKTQRSKKFGYVIFEDEESARLANKEKEILIRNEHAIIYPNYTKST